jgi:nucleotidyltransferase/DNA polymerase involved in DNA repair
MSVICCRIPNLLWTLAAQRQPDLIAHPAALVGPDDLIWAAGPQARAAGVLRQMTLRQAYTHCPELVLQPVALDECQSVQDTLLSTLATWELPLEETHWGHAYLDLHTVATTRLQVQPLVVELGRQVRAALGVELQPSIGWDSGKFTARAAGSIAAPGRARLVSREDEIPFLSPLPVKLLPLASVAKQELRWLGIETLGQFAKLPATAVVQRFGAAARMAHQWAQGHDPRPVHNNVRARFTPLTAPIVPPTGLLDPVVEVLLDLLRPRLEALALELAGCRKLHVDLHFLDGSTRGLHIPFVTAVGQESTLAATLTHHLQTLSWPAEVEQVGITQLETGELPAEQLPLLPAFVENHAPGNALVQRLKQVYGPIFYRGEVADPLHPLAPQRSRLAVWA